MTADVVSFTGETTLDEPPAGLLEKAKDWGMVRCLVIGTHEDGSLAIGGSFSDVGEMLLLLERAKRDVLAGVP